MVKNPSSRLARFPTDSFIDQQCLYDLVPETISSPIVFFFTLLQGDYEYSNKNTPLTPQKRSNLKLLIGLETETIYDSVRSHPAILLCLIEVYFIR